MAGVMPNDRVRNLICGLIAAVWAASVVAGMFVPTYHADPAVNSLPAAMLAFLFTSKDKDDDEKDDKGGDAQ